jgi:hypothetical protein
MNETPPPEHPGHEPLIEEPPQTPPHIPQMPPVQDPEPQEERI